MSNATGRFVDALLAVLPEWREVAKPSEAELLLRREITDLESRIGEYEAARGWKDHLLTFELLPSDLVPHLVRTAEERERTLRADLEVRRLRLEEEFSSKFKDLVAHAEAVLELIEVSDDRATVKDLIGSDHHAIPEP